ncbi:MAG: hypothetical protein ACKOE6_03440, partial [Flammeovirgaceae bacterium]
MQVGTFNISRGYATATSTIFVVMLLVWGYLHGGVGGHYILHQQDLPFISNWWGLVLLPVLTWICWGRIEKRFHEKPGKKELSRIFLLFLLGLTIGILISISFVNEYHFFLDNVLYILALASLIFPIYYSEFILGFVLGMINTFGVVIPTVFILIISIVGFLIYRMI